MRINWVKWLKERQKEKVRTKFDIFMDAVQDVGTYLGKKHGWKRVEVMMGGECVHMSYVTDKGLFHAMIPVRMITGSMMILPYMETAVLKMEKELLAVERMQRKQRRKRRS